MEVLSAVRGAKTKAQKSLRWPVARLEIAGPAAALEAFGVIRSDLIRAGNVEVVTLREAESPESGLYKIKVELAEEMPS